MAHPIFQRFLDVIIEHRQLLSLPGSPTGWLVGQWAKIMVFPQVLAPILILFGVPALDVILIFLARYMAMHVVYMLDRYMPLTRALGLCHLVTFGPLFVYLSLDFSSIYASWGAFGAIFVFQYFIIAMCLYMDARDLVLQMAGRPFPCYVRDHQRLGNVQIEDGRADAPVTMFSRVFW